jgi:uncharacterized protein
MSERDGFEPGVPCWVAAVEPESTRAAQFYSQLFGWETESMMSEDGGEYFYLVCKLRDREVAAIVSQGPSVPAPPSAVWSTHIWVQSADETAERVSSAGGQVIGPPFDSPGGGRVSILADPAGAIFCTWEPQSRKGAQLVNEPNAWAMSQLLTDDPDGAKAFYGSVFGWECEEFMPGVSLLRLPGFVGGEPQQPVPRDVVGVMAALGTDQAAAGVPPSWAVDFWIDDADAAAQRAEQLGGQVIASPQDTPGFRRAVLADPHGAAFSVSQLIIPQG